MILDPAVPLGVSFFEPGFKRLRRQMRADLTTEPMVVTAQAQTALDSVPRGEIVSPNQVVGLRVAPAAAAPRWRSCAGPGPGGSEHR